MGATLLTRFLVSVAGLAIPIAGVTLTGRTPTKSPEPLAADQVQESVEARVRPNRIRVIVTATGIDVDNETPGVQPDKVWGLPGGNVVFVIENRDDVRHTVSIPIEEFRPSGRPEFKDASATPAPLVGGQEDAIHVPAGARRTLVFRVQPLGHFQFDKRKPWQGGSKFLSMTYKYNIYTTPQGRARILLDPDLEIDQP